jgi:hypothetical protein
MEVLILSKTHFGNNVCVGGMVLSNNQYVRLINPGGWYQFADTEFDIGDIWDIRFSASTTLKEPHNEDVIIHSQIYLRTIDNITQFIQGRGLPIWRGSANNIFEGKIRWANSGAGFLSANFPNYPDHSVGFWLSDKPLLYENEHYFYPTGNAFSKRKLKYKGIPTPVSIIPVNTLLRLSLAKWWKPADSDVEERCYVQLSGWYDYEDNSHVNETFDDLPF